MNRTLNLTDDVRKFIDKLDPKLYKQIISKILSLMVNPIPQDSIQLKGNVKDYLRVNQGEYRIVYYFDENTLFIILVEKRNDDEVYKRLKRQR